VTHVCFGNPVLFDGRLAPLTYSIGFLNAPPKKVARAVARYFMGGPTIWGEGQ